MFQCQLTFIKKYKSYSTAFCFFISNMQLVSRTYTQAWRPRLVRCLEATTRTSCGCTQRPAMTTRSSQTTSSWSATKILPTTRYESCNDKVLVLTVNASPIPKLFCYTIYRCMRIERVQQESAWFQNLNGHLGRALDPKASSLALWTHSIPIQQNSAWKEIGGVIIEMLVSMLQTR